MIETVARKPRTRVVRPTEGSTKTGAVSRTRNLAGEKRGRGRPPGSKNKSKSMVPADLAEALLLKFQGVIPKEHFEYLKSVIKNGDDINTKKELDILILLLGRNLHPALVGEMEPVSDVVVDEETGEITETAKRVVFRKDVTERLKVLNSLLTLRNSIEKNEDSGKDGEQPLIKIVADRNLLADGRLGILVGRIPSDLAGNSDGTGRPAIPTRTVSNPVP